MKYFIDTEFIEGFHKPFFGKRRHFIDLISIGIVAEDGREYYAISNEFDTKDANDWVKKNVISKLPLRRESFYDSPNQRQQSLLWKSNEQIAEDVFRFVNPSGPNDSLNDPAWNNHLNKYRIVASENRPLEFYAYYADYDWVVFCSLFGKMIDLPKGFPMYCRDLKQILDEKISPSEIRAIGYEAAVNRFKSIPGYPIIKNEHDALADARWNRDLYLFLNGRKSI